jgi:hypothetical protein
VKKIYSVLFKTVFTGHIIQLNSSLYIVYRGEETLALYLFSRASSHWLTVRLLGWISIRPVFYIKLESRGMTVDSGGRADRSARLPLGSGEGAAIENPTMAMQEATFKTKPLQRCKRFRHRATDV